MINELMRLTELTELMLPDQLNGRKGTNRVIERTSQIPAQTDLDAINCWLAEFRDVQNTQRSYRKDAERLLLWAINERQKALSSVTGEDLKVYAEFLSNPQPAELWCGQKRGRKCKRWSEGWRPFQGPLKPPSKITALANLEALVDYVVEVDY